MNIDNLTSMVAAGEGVTLIPKLVLCGPTPGCAALPIAEKNLRLELLAVSNRHFHSGLVERFLEIVATEAAAVEQRLQEIAVPPSKSSAATRRTAAPRIKVAKRSAVQTEDVIKGLHKATRPNSVTAANQK